MFSLFNFSSIFPGGSVDPICPYVLTPMTVNVTLLAVVDERHATKRRAAASLMLGSAPAAVDRHLSPAGPTAANPPQNATDRHTPYRYIIKGSPYSITERRVLELIPVLGSHRAGGVSHKPGGRLPLLSARPAVTLATLKRAATNFTAW